MINVTSTFLESLLEANPSLKVKDKPKVENILNSLFQSGSSKLQIVTAFDHTLTKARNASGENVDCSWGVVENSTILPEKYRMDCKAIKAHYLPIELDPKLSVEDKKNHMVAWYTEANQALQRSGVRRNDFPNIVKASNAELREMTSEVFDLLAKAKVPVLVLSAGIGDVILEIMKFKNVFHPNLKVVSNFLSFDAEGHVVGLGDEIIHLSNKKESAIHQSDYFKTLDSRKYIILLGDSLGDLHMVEGMENPEAVLKIGFLNYNIEKTLESFVDNYDIVLVDDQTMAVPFSILKNICSH